MSAFLQQRFMERLTYSDSTATTEVDEIVLQRSVMQHISRIMNTRRGTVVMDPEYGVVDLSTLPANLSKPETEQLSRDISQTISKYEPRVSQVEVDFVGRANNNLALLFRLSVTLTLPQGRKNLLWQSEVGYTKSADYRISEVQR